MNAPSPPSADPQVRMVNSFEELVSATFENGVNALCWPRTLPGDYAEIVQHLDHDTSDGVMSLDADFLRSLPLSPAGKIAMETMLQDLQLLRDHDLEPILNCITAYPRDEEPGPIVTDVFSFHADSAPVEADTWLCTYHGACSERLPNDQVQRRVDVPDTRAELLAIYGGADDEEFESFLTDHCYDLHYARSSGSQPQKFGIGNLWRIAVAWPGSPVPPCVHRAPDTLPGDPPRLLLIS
ncbi:hypothetical protein JIN85_09170 [Luteolibacter pohnpeiensis]|uniref:DUF1826 domain-containing protein n=1 Tax=Luteolibacter pohnpeiensis TaxID=454153 RepID=A0A934S799_9BACT|nr:hypothetical protein [Luteolibacter pohnpeiensis]MBK1882585.1 hypothetical protein [Luteolibacter pohnpeiensis]